VSKDGVEECNIYMRKENTIMIKVSKGSGRRKRRSQRRRPNRGHTVMIQEDHQKDTHIYIIYVYR
jgi:hypothetical protein